MSLAILLSLTFFYPYISIFGNKYIFRKGYEENQVQDLERAIQAFNAALAVNFDKDESFGGSGENVFILSQYPFNFKHQYLVSGGKDRGIQSGDIALVPCEANDSSGAYPGIFIGKVDETFADSAIVKTIFDASFEAAVRIGESGIDALLKGGAEPRLTLIPRRAKIAEGDIIYTASENTPYGIAIGSVKKVEVAEDSVFLEASLSLKYDISVIRKLVIIPIANKR